MEIAFETTVDDIVAWQYAVTTSNPTMKPILAAIRMAVPVASAAALAGLGVLHGPGQIVAFAVVTWVFGEWMNRRRDKPGRLMKRLVAQQVADSPSAVGPRRLSVDGTGISEVHGAGAQVTRWSDVREAVLTPAHVFIRVGGGGGYIIPRRAVDGAALEAFMTRFRELHGQHAVSGGERPTLGS